MLMQRRFSIQAFFLKETQKLVFTASLLDVQQEERLGTSGQGIL